MVCWTIIERVAKPRIELDKSVERGWKGPVIGFNGICVFGIALREMSYECTPCKSVIEHRAHDFRYQF